MNQREQQPLFGAGDVELYDAFAPVRPAADEFARAVEGKVEEKTAAIREGRAECSVVPLPMPGWLRSVASVLPPGFISTGLTKSAPASGATWLPLVFTGPAVALTAVFLTFFGALGAVRELRGDAATDHRAQRRAMWSWWDQHRGVGYLALVIVAMLIVFAPYEGVMAVLLCSFAWLVVCLRRLSALGLASRQVVGRRCGDLLMALGMCGLMFWWERTDISLPILFWVAGAVVVLVTAWRATIGETFTQFVIMIILVVAHGLWTSDYEDRIQATVERAARSDRPYLMQPALPFVERVRELGPELDLTPLRERVVATVRDQGMMASELGWEALRLGWLERGVAPPPTAKQRQALRSRQRIDGLHLDSALLGWVTATELSDADRDMLADRIVAGVPVEAGLFAIPWTRVAHTALVALDRQERFDEVLPACRRLLVQSWEPTHAPWTSRGGFGWGRANYDAIELMRLVGVPDEVDLWRLRCHLNETRDRDPLDQLAAELLDRWFEVPAPRGWTLFVVGRVHLGALLLVVFCFVVVRRAPRGGAT